MIRQLLHNTLLSVGGILGVSILGLLIIPLIISTWGVTAFGLIVLARLALPSGIGALFDFGLSEVATQVVARARVSEDWDDAGRRISFLLTVSVAIGFALAIVLWVAAPFLVVLFKVAPEYQQSFELLVRFSAVANLLLMPALVGDGIIRGCENYLVVRGLEIVAAAAYVGGTVVCSYQGASYASVALVYLASAAARSVACLVFAWLALRGWRVRLQAWGKETQAEDVRRCWLVMQGKLLAGVLGPGIPVMIGALLGARAVGIYDTIVRLPRFSKVVSGLLSSAVLPVASRLEQAGAARTFQQLGQGALVLLPAITLPPLVGAALLSTDILRLWIGPTLAAYGPWMGLMFLLPMTTQFSGFAGVIFLTRPEVQAQLNRLMAVQIPLIAVVAALALPQLEERAFILAQVVAALLVLPLQLYFLIRSFELDAHAVYRALASQALILGLAALLFHQLTADAAFGLVGLGAIFAAWCVALWSIQYALTLSDENRSTISRLAGMVVPAGMIPLALGRQPVSLVPAIRGSCRGGTKVAEAQPLHAAQPLATASAADLAVNYSRDLARSLGRLAFKRVRRTGSVVDLEYESGHWQRVLSDRAWLRAKSVEDFLVGSDTQTTLSKVDGHIVRISPCEYRRYRLGALGALLRRLSAGTDSLVELGSGFGYNLFSLSCSGHWRSLKGFDIAPTGIEAGRQIAAHFGLDDRISFDRMDITNAKDANFAHLEGQTVFTFFCVEQIPYAVTEAVENLLRARPRRVINIEPATDMLDLRQPRDIVSLTYLRSMDYQTRLFGLLDRLESDGRLRVVARERMQFAPTIHNDGLLYCWEPSAP